MAVPMGKDGFDVLELKHMRGAVDVLIGELRQLLQNLCPRWLWK